MMAHPAPAANMNIVFDFGGVLFQWQPHEFMTRLLPQHAPDAESAAVVVRAFFENFGGEWGEFDRGTIEREPLADGIAQRTGLTRAEVDRVLDAVPHELQPIEGTVALLRRLHARGHALYFLSNMPAPYADHLEASHDFIGLFRAGVFSARVKMIKPEAAIFAHALEFFGIDADDTLFIDDVLHNAQAARSAGWQALHFTDPAQCEAELARRGLL
jgi:putative hydrolase of the HAD superfamily